MRKQKPAISVIMMSHNRPEYIGDAILSIKNQTFKDWELIIIDDSSDSNVIKKIVEFSGNDERIVAYFLPENTRLDHKRNVAMSLVYGDVIAQQDDDDYSYPNRLQLTYEAFSTIPDLALFSGLAYTSTAIGMNKITDKQFFAKNLEGTAPIIYEHPLVFNNNGIQTEIKIHGATLAWRTDYAFDCGLYDRHWNDTLSKIGTARSKSDWDFYQRLLAKHPNFTVVREIMAIYRFHSESVSEWNRK